VFCLLLAHQRLLCDETAASVSGSLLGLVPHDVLMLVIAQLASIW
jgi:hypothetical protein